MEGFFVLLIFSKVLLLEILISASGILSPMDQRAVLDSMRNECFLQMDMAERPAGGLYCPMVWDDISCWPYVEANTTWTIPCPEYIVGFSPEENASKYCTSEGEWFYHLEYESFWTNYTRCMHSGELHHAVAGIGHYRSMEKWLPPIRVLSNLGYSVSLGALLISFLILVCIRKLRCPRNSLHMNLYASFMMRALMALVKNRLFELGVADAAAFEGSEHASNGTVDVQWEDGSATSWEWSCKLLTSLWQYFIMANYSWVLMEGLYLHNLVFYAMFSDNHSILSYIILGWGLPVLIVLVWIACRLTMEDAFCWTINQNKYLFWLIRGPISLSIVLNFIFFVKLVRVLGKKLCASLGNEPPAMRYRKWAKSTLVLVPLFGIHYMIFLGMSLAMGVNETVEIIWLLCDQTFASFQGFFVAILYCLCNEEVRKELTRSWRRLQASHFPSGSPFRDMIKLRRISSERTYRMSINDTSVAMTKEKSCFSVGSRIRSAQQLEYSTHQVPQRSASAHAALYTRNEELVGAAAAANSRLLPQAQTQPPLLGRDEGEREQGEESFL